MQIVGEECHECGERIRSEAGAAACLECEAAFHERCASGDTCPSCGVDYAELWERSLREHAEATREGERLESLRKARRATGRNTFLAAILGAVAAWRVGRMVGFDPIVSGVALVLLAAAGIGGLALFMVNRDPH